MFGNGAQLLAALNPGRLDPSDLDILAGLSSARNTCEYEHGLLPKTPAPDEARRYLDKAPPIIARAFEREDELATRIAACRLPVLTVDS